MMALPPAVEIESARPDRWEFYHSPDGWRWRLIAPNGKIIGASTEGFSDIRFCEQNAARNGWQGKGADYWAQHADDMGTGVVVLDENNRFRPPPDWEATISIVPLSEVYDWSLTLYGIPAIWLQNRGQINGVPIRVAVLDTGVDATHPDLEGAIADAKDFTNSVNGPKDMQGHGTWCCSMIGARAQNDRGIAGIANKCEILSGKVLGDNGSGGEQGIANGIRWAVDKGAKFISQSFGGGRMSDSLRNLYREVSQQGVWFFTAAGNDAGPVNSPAAFIESQLPIGSVDKNGNLSRFTSRGLELLRGVIAPGEKMMGCLPGNRYGELTGTSMATPFACAIGVLAYGKHEEVGGATPLTNRDQMMQHLQIGSGKVGEYSLLNPGKILEDIIGVPIVPPPVVPPVQPPVVPPPGGLIPGGVWVYHPTARAA